MIGLLTFLLVVLAIALVVIVIIQPDRSHGMAGSFGGGAQAAIFGVSDDGVNNISPFFRLTFSYCSSLSDVFEHLKFLSICLLR